MEFTGLTAAFYDNVPIASIDMGDWARHRYRYIDVKYAGRTARVAAWDACADADCPDGTSCCTDNKQRFSKPGYLIDVEARTAKRLFNVDNAAQTLLDRVEYRVCERFDPDAIARRYGARRN